MADNDWNDDGWGDDDDLLDDIIGDENKDAASVEQETDGWGDDDDLDLNEIDAPAPAPSPAPTPMMRAPVPAPMPAPAPMYTRATAPVPAPAPLPIPAERVAENDGWDDDLENLSETLSEEDAAPAPAPMPMTMRPPVASVAPVPPPAPAPMPMRASERIEDDNNGWDDDLEDLSENLSGEYIAPTSATTKSTPVPAPAPAPAPLPYSAPVPAPAPVMENDGWGDDLDNLSAEDTGGPPISSPVPAAVPMRSPVPAPAPFMSAPAPAGGKNNDGWGDDDVLDNLSARDPRPVPVPAPASGSGWDDDLEDLNVEDDDMEGGNEIAAPTWAPPHMVAQAPSSGPSQVTDDFMDASDNMGWDDEDEDLFSDAMETSEPPQTPAPAPRPPPLQHHKLEGVHQELVEYVEALMVQLPSVNAVLDAEYNTQEKANELFQYYYDRPQLRQYTIEKEVDRMDYQVVLQHDDAHEPIVIDNKEEISRMFRLQAEMDMMVRCANQSLLADLLQVMTGPDRMVRPQYMATCLAQSCLFVLRPRQGTEGGHVECTSQLVLSLPEPSGERYPVANLQVHVSFGIPAHPQREQPTIQFQLQNMNIVLPNMDVLRPTAQFLLESGLLDHPPMSPFPESPAGNPINSSGDFRDVFLQQSQNVLQNSTVGLKSAWKQIDSVAGFGSKMNMMKRILPTGNNSVLEKAMREQEAYQREMQSHREASGGAETVPVSYPPSMKPQQQQAPSQQRPASILGSVWGRLAKTVTLPEEDPSIYQEYAQRQRAASADGEQPPHQMAHSPSSAQEPFVHLYRKDSLQEQQQEAPTTPSPAPTTPSPAPAPTPPSKMSPWLSRLTESSPSVSAPMPAPAVSEYLEGAERANEGKEDAGLDDGWDDDDDLVVDDVEEETKIISNVPRARSGTDSREVPPSETNVFDTSDMSTARSSHLKTGVSKGGADSLPECYGPEDDIIETRKRWVNPRPGYRQLRPLLS